MSAKEPNLTQALLARAHSPDSASRIFAEKIQYRPLLLRPSSPPLSRDARDARRRAREKKENHRAKKLKPKPLSARERRKLGLYEIPKEGQKYALFEPLHRLWLGYIREILGNDIFTGGQGAAAKLSSADFHGAEVEVSRSGCVSRVGIRGIVIKDSRFVFEVVTRKNELKIIPKEGTLFRVEVPVEEAWSQPTTSGPGPDQTGSDAGVRRKMVLELHGNQLLYRSADRASRKFKAHFLDKL